MVAVRGRFAPRGVLDRFHRHFFAGHPDEIPRDEWGDDGIGRGCPARDHVESE
jgi:hypothetical protein